MTTKEIIDYCMTKQGAWINFPFDDQSLFIRVGKRFFANTFVLKGKEKVTLKCTADFGQFLRSKYSGVITRGYHCPSSQQPYNNTIDIESEIDDKEMMLMIDHSYNYAFSKLTKAEQAEVMKKL